MTDRKGPSQLRRRRWWWAGAMLIAVGTGLIFRPAWHLIKSASRDVADREPVPAGFIDDASGLNKTAIHELWHVPADVQRAEAQLAALLLRARQDGLKVSVAGARHSMGGHSIAPDGIVIDMLPFNAIRLDASKNTVHVGAGAIWHDVLAHLDSHGKSVAIMQSNDSFSVGGSISVNCHGWQHSRPPIVSSVDSFRLMRPDGLIVNCSRHENAELFSLVAGGYGLFGIILDVNLRVVPNQRYKVERFVVAADDSLATYDSVLADRRDAELVYARLDVTRSNFLNEVVLYVMTADPEPDGQLDRLTPQGLVGLRRSIFRGSVGSEYGKRLRWNAETRLQRAVMPTHFTRNQLLDEGVEVFANRSAASTDILHEYFLPRTGIRSFIEQLRNIIPEHQGNLLNVTVRQVEEDRDSFLRYADQSLLSLVMLFNHQRSAAAEARMQAMTREMIDAVLEVGGRYYLPYRLHATREQFRRAYPQATDFFANKLRYDPDELFVNQFYLAYGPQQDSQPE